MPSVHRLSEQQSWFIDINTQYYVMLFEIILRIMYQCTCRYKTCLIAVLFGDVFFFLHTGQSATIKVIELTMYY